MSSVILADGAETLAAAIVVIVRAAVADALTEHACGMNEPAASEPLLLTYEQAWTKIGVTRSQLYRLMKAGEIRSLELSKQVRRISLAECERYVAALPLCHPGGAQRARHEEGGRT